MFSRFLILFFVLILAGCSRFQTIAVVDPRTGIEHVVPSYLNDVPGIRALAKACAEEAGRVVHQTVTVDGYFDADRERCEPGGCWDSFSMTKFRYWEFEVKEPKSYEFIKEPGLWRVSKQPLGDARCDPRIRRELEKYVKVRPRPLDECIVVERIDELKSRYRAESISTPTPLDDEFRSKLFKGVDKVVDAKNGDIIAGDTRFFLSAKYRKNMVGRQLTCTSLGFPESLGNFREAVIKPSK